MNHHLAAIFFTLFSQVLSQSLPSLIRSQTDLSNLLIALQAVPKFTENLASASDITILGPTDDAFARVPQHSPLGQALAQAAMATPDHPAPEAVRAGIRAVLAYHVLKGPYPASTAMETPVFVPTLLDESFEVEEN